MTAIDVDLELRQQAEAMVGGRERLNDLFEWAAGNLSEGAIGNLNEDFKRPDTFARAIDDLQTRRNMAVPGEQFAAAAAAGGCTSAADVRACMAAKDAASIAKIDATPMALIEQALL